MSKPKLLSPPEAAERLNVSLYWVRRAILQNRIPYVKVGRLVRFKESDLDAYIENRTEPAGSAHPGRVGQAKPDLRIAAKRGRSSLSKASDD